MLSGRRPCFAKRPRKARSTSGWMGSAPQPRARMQERSHAFAWPSVTARVASAYAKFGAKVIDPRKR